MLQSCDQYAPVMWSICTSHVSNVYKSRDQYATVMRSMCTSHVINMCYLATAWKYLVKAWALVKTICSQSQNLWLVNITFDRPFPKILWFLLFGGHLNQIVITILIVSIHFWYQLQHFFRIRPLPDFISQAGLAPAITAWALFCTTSDERSGGGLERANLPRTILSHNESTLIMNPVSC